ncbi:MAG: esterase-like activity of phytase family protein [Thiotrichaceae bacterium]|nr:esterase-like activity of phytase family protein [Thiotrichaceae bacterium]
MKKLLFFIPFYLILTGCSLQSSMILSPQNTPEQKKITILDERVLYYPKMNKVSFSEISDLSYIQKTNKLYMVGDKGNFYIFDAYFDKKIRELKYLNAFKITEKKQHKSYDSEGLTHDDKGQLYISFERYPRIAKINTKAYLSSNQKLTKELNKRKHYKGSNKMFEALTWHPKYGLLTAAEYPLHQKPNNQQTIYALDGKKWHFTAQHHENNAITAIEVMDDKNLLILERAFAGLTKPFVISLSKLYLDQCDKKRQCKSEVLASFNSQEGWGVNNYEGLARVGKNRYVMVSDNNNKSIITTQLIYFKVNE